MPTMYEPRPLPLRERVYPGFHGDTAIRKIEWSQPPKGFRAVFPDCPSAWAPNPRRPQRV